jgi:O-antigen ligase
MKRLKNKIVETLLALLTGWVLGKFILNVINFIESGESGGSVSNILSPLKLIAPMLQDFYLVAGVLGVIILYLRIYGSPKITSNMTAMISNGVIYLHAITLFFPWSGSILPLPSATSLISILFCLLLLCMFLPQQEGTRVPRLVKIALIVYVIWVIAGVISAKMGLNDVRRGIPTQKQISYSIYFADALLVTFFIIKNRWDQGEFDKMLKFIWWGCIIIFIECLATFYLHLLPMRIEEGYMRFSSLLIGRSHFSAGLGIFLVFCSLYFCARTGKKYYVLAALAGGLLAFSSMTRQSMVAVFLGLMMYFLFRLWKNRKVALPAKALLFIMAIILFGLTAVLTVRVSETYRERITYVDAGMWDRLSLAARGLDILVSHPFLGAGNGLSYFYFYSFDVPSVFTQLIPREHRDTVFWSRDMNADPGEIFKRVSILDENLIISTHNIPMKIIIENGLPGLILVLILMCALVKTYFRIFRLSRIHPGLVNWPPLYALLALIFATFLYVQTTSKFEPMWYFGMWGAFLYLTDQRIKHILTKSSLGNLGNQQYHGIRAGMLPTFTERRLVLR